MKQSGCLSLIKCTIQTTMCMQVRWTTTGQIINHLIVVCCIQPINKPVSEDMWPQLQPKSYVQKQHIPLGALATWARPDLRCTFSPKNHTTPWDQRGVFFPRPPGSSLDHGDWWWVHREERRIPLKATTTSKDQGILSTCLLCVCAHVYHTTNPLTRCENLELSLCILWPCKIVGIDLSWMWLKALVKGSSLVKVLWIYSVVI